MLLDRPVLSIGGLKLKKIIIGFLRPGEII